MSPDTEQVLVAVEYDPGPNGCNAVIIAWSPGKLADTFDGVSSDDVLSTRDGDEVSDMVPREKGLWLWEGVPHLEGKTDGLPPDESEDIYLMLGGTWRRPTVADLVAIGAVQS